MKILRPPPLASILVFVLSVSGPAAVSAQGLEVGVVAGSSFATFGGDIEGLDHRVGMALGFRVAADLSDHVQVESGLSWIQKGADGIVVGFEEPLRAAHRLTYLEIPLLLRAFLPTSASIRPTGTIGGSVAFEVGCDVDVNPVSSFLSPLDCNIDSGRRTTDWSLLVGGGLVWDLPRASLLLEGRYHHGLRDLRGPHSTFEVRNRAVSVVAGVAVPVRIGR